MGRKRKPKELHDLHGNPGHRQQPEGAPPAEKPTTCPKFLSSVAKQEWRRIAPELERTKRLTQTDRTAFASRCMAWDLVVSSYKALRRPRMVDVAGEQRLLFPEEPELSVATIDGGGKMNPDAAVLFKAFEAMRRFDAEFGLTPASRGNMPSPQGERDDQAKALHRFLFGQDPPEEASEENPDPDVVIPFSKR